jgi:HEAT repeat protein
LNPEPDVAARRRAVVVAGHTADGATIRAAFADEASDLREAALGAAHRAGLLEVETLVAAASDPAPPVRRRVAEIASARPDLPVAVLVTLLSDESEDVVETAAWACGELVSVDDVVLERLVDLAVSADAPLVREAAVAALGAIGDPRGLPAILHGCGDKPAVRRRAVLALAPFEGPDVDAAIERARSDRDWQVRQNADDVAPPPD